MAVSENILTNLRLPARADAHMVNSISSHVKCFRGILPHKAFGMRHIMNARLSVLILIGMALLQRSIMCKSASRHLLIIPLVTSILAVGGCDLLNHEDSQKPDQIQEAAGGCDLLNPEDSQQPDLIREAGGKSMRSSAITGMYTMMKEKGTS